MGLGSIVKEIKRGGRKIDRSQRRTRRDVEKTVSSIGNEMDELGDSIERELGLKPPDISLKLPDPPKTAPVTDDEEARIARMRDYQRRYRHSGREGTQLSRGSTLG